MPEEKNELDILFPNNEVMLAGEMINLRPFPFGKWPEIIEKAASIIHIVLDAYESHGEAAFDISFDPKKFHIGTEAFNLIVTLLTESSESVFDILAISANKPREWVEDLQGDDGITLLAGTFLVNRDFFSKRVLPRFQTILEGLRKKKLPKTARKSRGAK